MRKLLKYLIPFIAIALLLVLSFPGVISASPSVVYVDDDWAGLASGTDVGGGKIIANNAFPTIQGGLNTVTGNGTVYVAPGTYIENIDTGFKRVSLIGSGASSTIIDGSNSTTAPVVNIPGNTSSIVTITIEGFTIRNGENDMGGGVRDSSDNDIININNCTITKNHGISVGGGIYHGGSGFLTINNCIISYNEAGSGEMGGGIYNAGPMDIFDSIIRNNSADLYGGGIYNSTHKSVDISGTQIIYNTAGDNGGGIYNINGGSIDIINSAIYGNTSTTGVDGIFDNTTTSVNAQYNWWGSSSGPSGGIQDAGNPAILADGSGNEIGGHVYFYPWLTSNPFPSSEDGELWVRTMPMTCWQVWINEESNFQFIFWYPYKDKNFVKIYDIEGNMVFETDLPWHDPNLIVDLPDGYYMVRTYHGEEMIQEFLIGKPGPEM